MGLDDLPDDILITVLCLCDVDTLLSLRITSRPICAVIDTYIATIAPAVARVTTPGSAIPHRDSQQKYTLRWLRNLIPAQLAAIALDKDKLRRTYYINAGFPHGIPYEVCCKEALHWRARVANGWRVLRCFYLISRDVYATNTTDCDSSRPKVFRKMSGGVKSSRIWRTVSCQYQDCDEHGVKHLFNRRKSHHGELTTSSDGDLIEDVRGQEARILKERLQYLKNLNDQDLLDYTYVWRLLLWVFRPYRKPDTTLMDCLQSWNRRDTMLKRNWQAEINSIAQGHSWLNWFVLHVGTTPFWRQWSLHTIPIPDYIRNLAWEMWRQRSFHQTEVEREYICKFEFAVRKRCLSADRAKRLESELLKGQAVKTISLDCIPWSYDQHFIINRSISEFSWYRVGQWLWLDRHAWLRIGGGRMDNRIVWSEENNDVYIDEEVGEAFKRGPLEKVPYLVYLGVEDAKEVWDSTDSSTTGNLVF